MVASYLGMCHNTELPDCWHSAQESVSNAGGEASGGNTHLSTAVKPDGLPIAMKRLISRGQHCCNTRNLG
jgi:hypothetical protein